MKDYQQQQKDKKNNHAHKKSSQMFQRSLQKMTGANCYFGRASHTLNIRRN